MDISIIIPNYNGEELLKKNLPSVIDSVSNYHGAIEIIVVDDCSTDHSIKSIKYYVSSSKYKDIQFKILQNEKNMGFSSTVDKGVKEATGDLVLLLNTDVIPERNFLNPLIKHFQDEKVFAIGCMDKSVESGKVILRGRGIGRWQRGFFVHSRGEIDKTDTLWVSCGSGIFRKSIWDKLGGLDTLYNPFYWEDIDLSYRAIKSGYKILFEPKSIVVHEHEKGSIKKKYSESEVKTIAYRNQFIFVWKNATDLDLQFLHIFWLPYHFLKAVFRKDIAFFKGLFYAFIRLPEIIAFRLKSKKYYVKTDKKIVNQLSA